MVTFMESPSTMDRDCRNLEVLFKFVVETVFPDEGIIEPAGK
jgi:hypothetical protein